MSLSKKIIFAVVLYLLFLIATLPASQVLPRVANGNVALSNISGSIWSGKAEIAVVKGITVNNLKWDVNPWWLLLATVSVDVNGGNKRAAQQLSFDTEVAASLFGLSVSDLDLYVPANLLTSNLTLPFPVALGGRLKADIKNYRLGKPYCSALTGKAEWLSAEIQGLAGMISLQNFAADLSCDSGDVVVKIAPNNMLNLSGEARLAANQKLSADVTAKPDVTLPRDIHQAFEFLANKNPNGEYRIQF